MQVLGYGAKNAARLVVLASGDHCRERARAGSPLEQQRWPVLRQDLGGAIAIPPGHQRAAAALLVLARDLQHGLHAIVAHGQKQG